MMIGNLIKCKHCGRELQPEEVLVGPELKPICAYCKKECYENEI